MKERKTMDELEIQKGGQRLVDLYRSEVRRMVANAVAHDEQNETSPGECRLLIYKDVGGVHRSYDLERYPFGKCGQRPLKPDDLVAAVSLSRAEKRIYGDNADLVVDALTDKLLATLPELRAKKEAETPAAGAVTKAGNTPPTPG